MLKNYIAVLIRYMLKNKQYVVLNIAGLAIGMTTVMLIALFVRHEFSYDRLHKDSHLLYRVLRETRSDQGQSTYSERLSGALGQVIREEMPEVNQVVRLHRRDAWIKYQDRVFEQIFCLADERLMEMFHFPGTGLAHRDPYSHHCRNEFRESVHSPIDQPKQRGCTAKSCRSKPEPTDQTILGGVSAAVPACAAGRRCTDGAHAAYIPVLC